MALAALAFMSAMCLVNMGAIAERISSDAGEGHGSCHAENNFQAEQDEAHVLRTDLLQKRLASDGDEVERLEADKSVQCPAIPEQEQTDLVGACGENLPAENDTELATIIDESKAIEKLNADANDEVKACYYCKQVVAGTNYQVTFCSAEDTCYLAKIFAPLPSLNKKAEVTSIEKARLDSLLQTRINKSQVQAEKFPTVNDGFKCTGDVSKTDGYEHGRVRCGCGGSVDHCYGLTVSTGEWFKSHGKWDMWYKLSWYDCREWVTYSTGKYGSFYWWKNDKWAHMDAKKISPKCPWTCKPETLSYAFPARSFFCKWVGGR